MGSVTGELDDRQHTAQEAPPADLDLSGFPVEDALPPVTLYRAHTASNGPWWFSSSGSGRFDLSAPRGTCYAADDVGAALRERLGRHFRGGGRAPARLIDDTAVTVVIAPHSRAANLEDPGVAAYPITGELVTMAEYSITRAWAGAFDRARFDAIHYRGRFSHAAGVACWALFGDAGQQSYPIGGTSSGRDICELAGIAVMPPPPTDASTLRVIPPPS